MQISEQYDFLGDELSPGQDDDLLSEAETELKDTKKDYEEPVLETATEIKGKTKKDNQEFFETEEKINKVYFEATKKKEIKDTAETIDDVVKGGEHLKQDTEDLFIYGDDDLSNYDEITPEDKRFIIDIVNQTNFNGDKQIFITYEDVTIEILGVDSEINKENEQDEINKGEKKDEAVKENMIADDVKIKNEFSDELEKLKKKKKDLRVRDRMARNGRPKTSKKLKKLTVEHVTTHPMHPRNFF